MGYPPEAELVRVLAGTRAARSTERISPLLEASSGEPLCGLLTEQRLLTPIGPRVLDARPGFGGLAFRRAVDAVTERTRTRARAIELLAAHICQGLESQGIATLPLKGPFLARRLYGDPACRMTNDLDLLVAKAELDRATAIIASMGFVRDESGSDELHRVLRHREGKLPRIEVHWRVHWYEDEFSRDLLARSRRADGLREPAPLDELASLLLFYARDGFYGLRSAADIAGWWDRFGPVADERPVLAEHLRRYPSLRRALNAAARVAERVVEVPAAELVGAAPLGTRGRRAARLANWTQVGELDQLSANIALVDGLLSPRGEGASFWRRHVWRSPEEIAELYGRPQAHGPAIAALRLAHVPKQLFRFCLGVIGYRGRGGQLAHDRQPSS